MRIVIFFCMLHVVSFAHAQLNFKDKLSYEVMYNLTYQINREDTVNLKSENMALKLGADHSHFISNNKLSREAATADIAKTGKLDMRNLAKSDFDFQIVKDYQKNQTLFLQNFGATKLFYDNTLHDMKWELGEEERVILDYKCKIATTTFAGRDYIAWYAINIPIPNGPYMFGGLPGLILEIYDTQNHYHFKVIGLENSNRNYELNFSDFRLIPRSDFKSYEKKIRDKPSLMAQSDKLSFPKEMLDKIDANGKKKFAYENNPIELK